MKPTIFLFFFAALTQLLLAQENLPIELHPNLKADKKGRLFFMVDGEQWLEDTKAPAYTLTGVLGSITGDADGLRFEIPAVEEGRIYFGLIPYGETVHPQPVFFKRAALIKKHRASIAIAKEFSEKYDMVNWAEKGYGTIGYRIVNQKGEMIYDGRVTFSGKGPFTVAPTIVEGPFIHNVTSESLVISLTSLRDSDTILLSANGKTHRLFGESRYEVAIAGLEADSNYEYCVTAGRHKQCHTFKTAPPVGAKVPFSFAYASDSRAGNGGGERNIYGANAYIMKRIAALAHHKEVAFVQFSGDLINGYSISPDEMNLQYANWKRAIEPYAFGIPWYISFGNHEALSRRFRPKKGSGYISLDRFPYDTESGEVVFANNFVNPENGLVSEDNTAYDPDPNNQNFPPYRRTVFHYQYGNTAVVVLNSNYWYAPNKRLVEETSGGLHAYIMDAQLEWFKNTISQLEKDTTVEHIFLTLHTPFFPNGGHVSDDMWYRGNNKYRSYVGGKPLEKGILERRDELLDVIVNQSEKVVAILTGDEHNYAKTLITPNTTIYPEDWTLPKLSRKRSIWQINNGAAGAPYYAQEQTPWTESASNFSTQNALVFFHIDGETVKMEVINPETFEKLDEAILTEVTP
ncbi:MAG: metallophosphoesterase [Schleiferiaceae bacterium]|nr:metallophosphoesterase [Schleiferiaceae bacterium]